jgi:hypothetical protein
MVIRSPHPHVDVPDLTLTGFVLAGAAASIYLVLEALTE